MAVANGFFIMRVITGTARGRKLESPEGMDTRPTAEMVKEAVFSIIQFEIEGASVLDLFAGSGQMGIEALSRGAKSCVFLDHSKKSCQVIRENLALTGLAGSAKIESADIGVWLKTARGQYDIAFLDPPYDGGFLGRVLPDVAALMRRGAAILCESSMDEVMPETVGLFYKKKEYRYGKTKITLYREAQDAGITEQGEF